MLVKTQVDLQPKSTPAYSVIVYDNAGNPIFAATHFIDNNVVVAARVGEPDFQAVLNLIGDDVAPKVETIQEK